MVYKMTIVEVDGKDLVVYWWQPGFEENLVSVIVS